MPIEHARSMPSPFRLLNSIKYTGNSSPPFISALTCLPPFPSPARLLPPRLHHPHPLRGRHHAPVRRGGLHGGDARVRGKVSVCFNSQPLVLLVDAAKPVNRLCGSRPLWLHPQARGAVSRLGAALLVASTCAPPHSLAANFPSSPLPAWQGRRCDANLRLCLCAHARRAPNTVGGDEGISRCLQDHRWGSTCHAMAWGMPHPPCSYPVHPSCSMLPGSLWRCD